MSFLRPELQARLHPWREPLGWGVLVLAGLALAWRGLARDAPLGLVAGAGLAAVALGFALAAVRRVRFVAAPAAEGVVTLDEGRLGYFASQGGGFVDVAALVRVEIVPLGGGRAWRLAARDGTMLAIPLGARDAGLVYDALGALPGMDYAAALAALNARTPGRVRVWSAAR